MSADSTQRALDQMQRANTIFEPSEKTWWSQLINILIWVLELACIAAAVYWAFS